MAKKIIVALTLFAVALLSANRVVWGQTPNPGPLGRFGNVWGIIDYKNFSGGIQTIAYHDVGGLKGSEYFPNLPLWPAGTWPPNHITRPPHNNKIAHYAGSTLVSDTYNLVLGAGPVTGSVSDAANRLWDNAYGLWGYTKVDPSASIDPSQNCHGYSTELNTWASIQPILNDNYEQASNRLDYLVPGAILANLGAIDIIVKINGVNVVAIPAVGTHSSRIDYVDCTPGSTGQLIGIVEKIEYRHSIKERL